MIKKVFAQYNLFISDDL